MYVNIVNSIVFNCVSMCIKNYRANKIRKLDKYEIEAVAKKIIDYIEINKFRLLFLTKKQICEELNISHYKLNVE